MRRKLAILLVLLGSAASPPARAFCAGTESILGYLVRPVVHVGRLVVVDLPADDGAHDAGHDVRMPVHVLFAPRLRRPASAGGPCLTDGWRAVNSL